MTSAAGKNGFELQRRALANGWNAAWAHYTLFIDLEKEFAAEPSIYDFARDFWRRTLNAHRKCFLYELARLYDKRGDTLHLSQLLSTITNELGRFSAQPRKKRLEDRLADRVAIDGLMNDYHPPTKDTVDRDIRLCTDVDPLVKALLHYRNNSFAHINRADVDAGTHVSERISLSDMEIRQLFDRARNVMEFYSDLFDGCGCTTVSKSMDHSLVFQAIRTTMEKSSPTRRCTDPR